MQQTFIIEGGQVEAEVKSLRISSHLLDVTPVGHRWRQWQPSEQTRVELDGMTPSGKEIRGVFRVVDRLEDGTMVLEPWSDPPTVGGKE